MRRTSAAKEASVTRSRRASAPDGEPRVIRLRRAEQALERAHAVEDEREASARDLRSTSPLIHDRASSVPEATPLPDSRGRSTVTRVPARA